MDKKMVTVVLPTFNGQEHIRESIDSIINQTFSNWELIIVDDCSSDNTADIVDEYAFRDERISVIHNEENRKLPTSLNIGFAKASGDYYTWTSDDNSFSPNALERMLREFEISPDADIVYSDYYVIDSYGKTVNEIKHNIQDNIFRGNIVGASFLYKRAVDKALNGYDENLFLAEDYDFWIRAYLERFCFKQIHENLYYYRVHDHSLTGTKMHKIVIATNQVYKRIEDTLDIEERSIVLQNIINNIYAWDYSKAEIKKYLVKLKKNSPEDYRRLDFAIRSSGYVSKRFYNAWKRILGKLKGGINE